MLEWAAAKSSASFVLELGTHEACALVLYLSRSTSFQYVIELTAVTAEFVAKQTSFIGAILPVAFGFVSISPNT